MHPSATTYSRMIFSNLAEAAIEMKEKEIQQKELNEAISVIKTPLSQVNSQVKPIAQTPEPAPEWHELKQKLDLSEIEHEIESAWDETTHGNLSLPLLEELPSEKEESSRHSGSPQDSMSIEDVHVSDGALAPEPRSVPGDGPLESRLSEIDSARHRLHEVETMLKRIKSASNAASAGVQGQEIRLLEKQVKKLKGILDRKAKGSGKSRVGTAEAAGTGADVQLGRLQ